MVLRLSSYFSLDGMGRPGFPQGPLGPSDSPCDTAMGCATCQEGDHCDILLSSLAKGPPLSFLTDLQKHRRRPKASLSLMCNLSACISM